jgi:hypothetical protein
MWVKLDDGICSHPKILAAGPLAAWQFVAGLCYCATYLTDGLIEDSAVAALVPNQTRTISRRCADRLVRAGLWHREEGGWRVHDYHAYQPTADKVRAERLAAAHRMRTIRSGEVRPNSNGSEADVRANFNGSSGEVRKKFARSSPSPSRPVLSSTTETEEPKTKKLTTFSASADNKNRTGPVWAAYSYAYRERYHSDPTRNATVNGILAKFLDRIPRDEAAHVAAFYVRSDAAFYVRSGHAVSLLLRDAEKLRTEWFTGRRITETGARQLDQHGERGAIAERLLEKAAREEADSAKAEP